GFTGVVNVETIGGTIIECHLRMSEQWLDLNGKGWLTAVVRLYSEGVWCFRDKDRRDGYSVVLFQNGHPDHLRAGVPIRGLLERPNPSSIQITFDPATPPEQHAMPPGGFRLAIVNCWNLTAGRKARSDLRRLFEKAS